MGINRSLPPPPPFPSGHTAVAERPGPPLTEKQMKKLLNAQKKEAKHAKKAAKKVQSSCSHSTRFIDLTCKSIYVVFYWTSKSVSAMPSPKSAPGFKVAVISQDGTASTYLFSVCWGQENLKSADNAPASHAAPLVSRNNAHGDASLHHASESINSDEPACLGLSLS